MAEAFVSVISSSKYSINDFRKFKNIIVMLVSGVVATIGYNTIPFQAYIIVAALSALLVATLLTLINLKQK